ncbi:Acylphosphatase [Afipia felis]|uniref:Acylphosphatase n=1 Tax=Afipia felis TaxID=1035 RepID=A0A090N6Y8_AFIFE|nr:acylphosphatase [Afipia felis]CEG07678.1 Acylphosphatase [Afipia felis]
MARTIRHLLIHGRVQGVGFRAWAQDTAEGLGVEGWVRNRRGGEVEMLIAGSPQAVAAMAEACRRGPSFAHAAGSRSERRGRTNCGFTERKGVLLACQRFKGM